MNGFIDALKQFVNVEYDTQGRETREMWRQSLRTRVAQGEAIADIEVASATWNRALLSCRDNLSKFRPPDRLLLNRGNPAEEPRYACVLEEDRGTELVVRAGYGVSLMGLPQGGGWVLDRNVVDIRFIVLGALETLAFSSPWQEYILGILRGDFGPQLDVGRERQAHGITAQLGFNASQVEAFAGAYATINYSVVQGPPGTGKTWVLAYLATALAQQGERVLVTAFTHRAINNALRKIAQETAYRHVFKVGQSDYAADLVWDGSEVRNFERFDHSPYPRNVGGVIVGGTCFAVRTARLKGIHFDTVIFDEAGQMTLPLAISGMLSGRKYVFIGDHNQMAPVITGKHHQKWVTRSVFETLFRHTPGTMLDTTYRMNAEINDFPSRRFYGGRLRPSEDARDRVLQLSRPPRHYTELLDPARPSVFAEVHHIDKGMRAPAEAEVAAGVAAEALACGVPPGEIAIVAPYRAQGRLIRRRLRELAGRAGEDSLVDIVVDTVERIQGQERDMVIVSLTTSDPGHAAQRAEFYFQPNRLNVAITRPRVKRIVIGSPLLFRATPKEREHRDWVDHFRALYHESDLVSVTP